MSVGRQPTQPTLLPFQQQNVATNQQRIPLPYIRGTQLSAIVWISPALNEVTQQAQRSKKG